MHNLKLPTSLRPILRCPNCKGRLSLTPEHVRCSDDGCGSVFPVVEGVPVLINARASVFRIEDFVNRRSTTMPVRSPTRAALKRLLPTITKNIKAKQNYRRFQGLLTARSPVPRVLVVGGGTLGEGMSPLLDNSPLELLESDVSFGPRTMLICDAHDLPFEDGAFEGVVVQAVLEHVVNPYRCVEEIHRVLKEGGLVYAETPFMQQVHMGRYDFTRFTHLGHRRLFRGFSEIDSGAVCGPGMALAWAYQGFLLSFVSSPAARVAVKLVARLTSFYLKYLDYFLINRPGALDAASACYFMGRKGSAVLSDKELITLYRGAGEP